jgi:hypothetical protein
VRRTLGLGDDGGRYQAVVKAHKIVAFLTIEGGHQIDDNPRVLQMYSSWGTVDHADAFSKQQLGGLLDGPAGAQGANGFRRRNGAGDSRVSD